MLYATVRQRKIYVKSPVTVIQNGVNVDTLILDMDEEWKEMTSIVCVFTNGEVAKQVLHTFGNPLTVPWECLASTGSLILSVTGFVGEEKVMTTAKSETGWNIVQNGTANGDASASPTPQLLQQVTAAAESANSAATAANNAATAATNAKNTLEQAAANGDFDGSTPEIGENGNWYINGEDTGKPSNGNDGKTPVVGVDYFTESDKQKIVDKVTAESKESLAAIKKAEEDFKATVAEATASVTATGEEQKGAVESAGAAQLEAVNAAGSTQKQAVEDAGKAQTKAVNDAGAAQTKAVTDAGTSAVADVGAAKDSALEEINAAIPDIPALALDDSQIDGKGWSSKHIVDMLCPAIDEAGNPVQCYPVTGYPLDIVASWKPMQEGSGDQSPDNIRKIKGRDSVTVERKEDSLTRHLTLPSTIYGGEVNAGTGEGGAAWQEIAWNGTEKWSDNGKRPDKNEQQWALYSYFTVEPIDLISSHFRPGSGEDMQKPFIRLSRTSIVLHVDMDGSLGTADGLKSYMAAQYAAGTPVQIAYKLAEAIPFTAIGGETLPALDGVNTILTDADSVTVKARADPNHVITELQDALASITETKEG